MRAIEEQPVKAFTTIIENQLKKNIAEWRATKNEHIG
jgi:hypothetical protein